MASISNGVEIELGGETVTLKPSLKAARMVSRISNGQGFYGVYQSIANHNFDVFAQVVKAGVTMKNTSSEDLDQMVYDAGMYKLTEPLTKFVRLLETGGRDEAEKSDEDTAGNDQD